MYESKAKITKITATSRVAVKVKDNYYTIEYAEERAIPDVDTVDIDIERELLFDDINKLVDSQISDIIVSTHKK